MKPTIIFLICFFIVRTAVQSQVISFEIDESKFKTELLPTLDTLYNEDQSFRNRYFELITDKAPQTVIDSMRTIIK